MNLQALKDLISAPPYDTMTDAECVAALNAPTVTEQGDVTKSKYVLWLAANNGFEVIEQAKAFSDPVPEVQAGVRAAGRAAEVILNAADVPVIDTGDPQVEQLFGLFQQVGLLSAEAVESFMVQGRSTVTPAQTVGWVEVNTGDIQQARAL
jgi:hypothetical protein